MSLTWLPLSLRKNIQLPKIQIEPNIGQDYGGWYCRTRLLISVVEPSWMDSPRWFESILAHEYKHHLQHIEGIPPKVSPVTVTGDYEKDIAIYFINNNLEYEALLFQNKYVENETTDWWLRKLVIPKLNKNVITP